MKSFDPNLKTELQKKGILAVLEINNVKDAVPVAKALIKGGISVIELALRTPAAEAAIKAIAKDVPEMTIGVGTVLRTEQVNSIKNIGARFGLAPGFNPNVLKAAQEAGLPFAPGISTASELEAVIEMGCDVIKLFPAGPLGGIKYFNSMTSPYTYLNPKFIPLGGINIDNLKDWAKSEKVLAIGGTWIAKRNLIEAGNFEQITKNAKEAVAIWKEVRG